MTRPKTKKRASHRVTLLAPVPVAVKNPRRTKRKPKAQETGVHIDIGSHNVTRRRKNPAGVSVDVAQRNPRRVAANAFPYVVQKADKGSDASFYNCGAFPDQHHAEDYAKDLHRKYPDMSIRVIRV